MCGGRILLHRHRKGRNTCYFHRGHTHRLASRRRNTVGTQENPISVALFDLAGQVSPRACCGDAVLRPGLTLNPPGLRHESRTQVLRSFPPLRSHHPVKGTVGRLPGGGGAHSQGGAHWQDGRYRPRVGIPAQTPLNIRSSEDPFDPPRTTWGGGGRRAPAPPGRDLARGGGEAPRATAAAYLQHVPRDELLTAVTADAELGVVVGFAVGQAVPAGSQAVRTGGPPQHPKARQAGVTKVPAWETRSEGCRNATWQPWGLGGDLAVQGLLGAAGSRGHTGWRRVWPCGKGQEGQGARLPLAACLPRARPLRARRWGCCWGHSDGPGTIWGSAPDYPSTIG